MHVARVLAFLALAVCGFAESRDALDWTHFVRIGGHGLSLERVDEIVRSATGTHVFGIEVDNDIPGRYESFLNPAEKLKAIRAVAEKAHSAGNRAFVYIAGLECITANADASQHSFYKDHPDWVQRKITGEPAVFGGGSAFWIRKGDEDVWISPYASEWRKVYMERVRQIAATGIDGVYVDIPYWMTHFDGWEDTWASFDDYTVAAFRAKTGIDAKKGMKLGDFGDPSFRRWVDFRIETITDFMKEIDANVKAANPKCKTIAEIYPGIDEAAVRVGSDVYDLYRVVDTIAHEYSSGGRAAERSPLAWFENMAGMYSFRGFAGGKPSWMLSYSWDDDKQIAPADAMKNLAMAQLMAGTNTWDARGHVMSGSNDFQTRKLLFGWMSEHEKLFFHPRQPVRPIGLYFSNTTRNYFARDFMESYGGMLILLLQAHLEFQIVTPGSLDKFRGDSLILPDVRCVSEEELTFLSSFIAAGKTLIVTGDTGKYDQSGAARASNPLHKLLAIRNPTEKELGASGRRFAYYPDCPGKRYYAQLRKEFDGEAVADGWEQTGFDKLRRSYAGEFLNVSGLKPAAEIEASPFVSTQVASVDGKLCVFMANFKGLKANQVARQAPERGVKITFQTGRRGTIRMLPFLGEVQTLPGLWEGGKLTCEAPPIERGAVVWLEP